MAEVGAAGAPSQASFTATNLILERTQAEIGAFLRSRVGQLAKYTFLIHLGLVSLWAVSEHVFSVAEPVGLTDLAASIPAIILPALVWWVSRIRSLTTRALWTLDASGTVLVGVGYATLALFRGSLEVAFVPTSYFVLLRAAILPCGAPKTLAVTAAAFAPSLILVPFLAGESRWPESWVLFVPRIALWCAIPAVISHVIYGLRREAREARKVGPYTLERKIGEGGMGQVYKARHALLKRPTALKILTPDGADDTLTARFELEVQETSRLTHPNTVAIYDFGRTPDGRFYYSMEYLPGWNLASLVKRHGPQPTARVIHILQQACGSLAEAHSKGIIHRDIKPENIILCERGGILDYVKLVDFGLVKRIHQPEDSGLTAPNIVLGTIHYIPPEALRATATLDGRSDLYALGAVGYFLLTGKTPFQGENFIEVSVAQVSGRVARPSTLRGESVTKELEDLLLSCLERDADRRPQDAKAMSEVLARCAEGAAWSQEDARDWWGRRGADEASDREA